MNDMKAFLFQVFQQPGQRCDRRGMDIMKQQNTLAARFQSSIASVMILFDDMRGCQSSATVSELKDTRWRAASSLSIMSE